MIEADVEAMNEDADVALVLVPPCGRAGKASAVAARRVRNCVGVTFCQLVIWFSASVADEVGEAGHVAVGAGYRCCCGR